MPSRIEDYAVIGDLETAALVAKDGSIDWLCVPRFDSGACFAALLGTPENGRWLVAPAGGVRDVRRRYRENTLVLETDFETDHGLVTLIDCMPVRTEEPVLVRIVEGKRGQVPMRMELVVRYDYGSVVPWVRRTDRGIRAIAGPNNLLVDADVQMTGEHLRTVAEFTVSAGQRVAFSARWHPSYQRPSAEVDAERAVRDTERWWQEWSARCTYEGPWRAQVLRSLITLKALTFAPTGGIVAAATTSLPEQLGGVRNWDYRYCWLRDATFTLLALMHGGYHEEAGEWCNWLLRAIAGKPSATQIMYGITGERRLSEWEVSWLPGYQGARPVRVGNAAHEQFQLDVYGEVIDAMFQAYKSGIRADGHEWRLVEKELLDFLEKAWHEPDEGIWEVRGPRRNFTHSKMMAWVAFDRAVKEAERFDVTWPVERWRAARDTIHQEVCEKGFNSRLNAFVQYYGASELDASLLMMPLVGFLPASDPRVCGTVEAIRRNLSHDGFVARYSSTSDVDGLPPGEGAFLACTFWLADNLALMGRHEEARDIFERLLGLCNDVGLLSEEYDAGARRLVGNFPQAFSHVGLVNTAFNLAGTGPAHHRCAHG